MLYRKNITINKLLNVNFVLTRNNTMKNQLAKIIHVINFLQDFDTYKNNSKILYNVCIKKNIHIISVIYFVIVKSSHEVALLN